MKCQKINFPLDVHTIKSSPGDILKNSSSWLLINNLQDNS